MWPTLLLCPTPPLVPFISTTNLRPPPPPDRLLSAPRTAVTRRTALRVSATSQEVGGQGKAVPGGLSAGAKNTTNPSSNPQQGKKKANKEEPKKEKQITGSDILRALQRVSARKAQISSNKKMQQQRRTAPDSVNRTQNANRGVDYDKVRALTIKSDWATRLDELEKRLQEFLSI
uniref:Uncharacterized protein n=1 Tax=Opuntia streptacantha TaxID=393608 RepID=A0A7C8ZTD3_OPUST